MVAERVPCSSPTVCGYRLAAGPPGLLQYCPSHCSIRKTPAASRGLQKPEGVTHICDKTGFSNRIMHVCVGWQQ